MSEPRTRPTDTDPRQVIAAIEHDRRRTDALTVLELMEEVTGEPPVMWGESIIGYGRYRMTYANGREADWMLVGFAPRKTKLVLYIMSGFDAYDDLLTRLGKHKTGASCLYINKLADVNMDVLRELVAASVAHMRATNPSGEA